MSAWPDLDLMEIKINVAVLISGTMRGNTVKAEH